MIEYENFKDMKDNNPELADQLLNMVGQGDWQNYQLFCYEDSSEYAKYEVSDGWYAQLELNECSSFDGAPNLYDYIDFDSLGEDLLNSVDESEVVELDDCIITTNYGF
jgi:hypothetical protein